MKKTVKLFCFLLATILLSLTACDERETPNVPPVPTVTSTENQKEARVSGDRQDIQSPTTQTGPLSGSSILQNSQKDAISTEEAVAQKIQSEIHRSKELSEEARRTQVSLGNQRLILDGSVNSPEEKRKVEEIASRFASQTDIVNQLQVNQK